MRIYLQGLTPSGKMVPIAVREDGALPLAQDNGTPGFIAFTATPVAAALPDHSAAFVEIFNDTQTDILVDHGAGTGAATLRFGNSHIFKLAASTKELRLSVAAGEATPSIIEYWG